MLDCTYIIFSLIALTLSLAGLLIFVSHFWVNAKKDELEQNNEQVMNVLKSVQQLSEKLRVAGTSLSQISENESSSAEELSATSEHLAESNAVLSSRTDESMNNLGELSEWENVMADNVKKVETSSKDLLDKSMENERLLNASIEAARAGEAGMGFAVVATEVGNLAGNTQETLREVESVIARVQHNVNEITTQVEENSSKIDTQNEYFEKVFKSMKEMTELLHVSVQAVATMGDEMSQLLKSGEA